MHGEQLRMQIPTRQDGGIVEESGSGTEAVTAHCKQLLQCPRKILEFVIAVVDLVIMPRIVEPLSQRAKNEIKKRILYQEKYFPRRNK